MARTYHKKLEFPLGGLDKSTGYQNQKPFTSAWVNNFLPFQNSPNPATGRARGGTRLGVESFDTFSGQPCNWAPVTWVSGDTYRGVAVSSKTGVWIAPNSEDSTFVQAISTAATSNFNSCTTYDSKLYFARGGQSALYAELSTPGSVAGEAIPSAPFFPEGSSTAPTDCGLVCVHEGRLMWAGCTTDPHNAFFSRISHPHDYDYAQTDASAAVALAGSQTGKIGEPITSLIPHTDHCTIVGCTDSMYVVNGNPTGTDAVYQISNEVGPLMQAAWCKTGNGWTYFLTRDGLYRIPPGCPSNAPEQVSRKNLPEELVAINPGTAGTYVSLAYDSRWRGIHIYVNKSGGNTYYFYDLEHGGFWPMTFSQTFRLAVNHKIVATATDSALLAITSAGASYQFTSDSAEDIASYCTYGPILLAPQGVEGRLNEVVAVLAENSSAVSWKLYVGNSAADAYTKLSADDPDFTGVNWAVETNWEKGHSGTLRKRLLQYTQNPLLSGQCAYLKIYNATDAISVEEIELTTTEAGPRRVL